MNGVKMTLYVALIVFGLSSAVYVVAQEVVSDESAAPEVAEAAEPEVKMSKLDEMIAKLPEDKSPSLTVMQLQITGNSLISTEQIFKKMPLIYEADPNDLYDFRVLGELVAEPNWPRQVSERMIQGFTQYVLSLYMKKHYGGIYVHAPDAAAAIENGTSLEDNILQIRVIEAFVSDVAVTIYDANGQEVEQGYLSKDILRGWSPAKPNEPLNTKKLNDFVNLLNINPDRYASPTISKGAEPNSLAVGYNIYEANPWHFYIQVDNSGTNEREWAPRLGLINTNLTGRDDRFSALYQAPWEKGIEDNYTVFGSYDVPLFTQWLRLNLYAGYNEFDITPEGGPLNFLGRGQFYGAMLRYNLLQEKGWFLDITGSATYEESKVTPELFPSVGSEVKYSLWGVGSELHRSDDMSSTSLGFNRVESFNADDSQDFDDARTGAEPDFAVYTASAYLSRYIDPNKVQRLSGSFRWIYPDERLVPGRMTAFGGLYSVRGYDEYESVADGGILASLQYEFDLVSYYRHKERLETEAEEGQAESVTEFEAEPVAELEEEPNMPAPRELRLRKLAPLFFLDYAKEHIKDRGVGGDPAAEEFASWGVGTIVEVGDNFSGAVYYGYPLMATEDTSQGKGRVNVSLMLRF
ncbi:MAG: ShlB/FhaC/HecB family hemolysin secretion/activation protein [Planctomycetota bacterium]|jgi:hemolysin activation/secretion protein